MKMIRKNKDLTGLVIGVKTVLKRAHPKRDHWLIRCECGRVSKSLGNDFVRYKHKTCMCERTQKASATKKKNKPLTLAEWHCMPEQIKKNHPMLNALKVRG